MFRLINSSWKIITIFEKLDPVKSRALPSGEPLVVIEKNTCEEIE